MSRNEPEEFSNENSSKIPLGILFSFLGIGVAYVFFGIQLTASEQIKHWSGVIASILGSIIIILSVYYIIKKYFSESKTNIIKRNKSEEFIKEENTPIKISYTKELIIVSFGLIFVILGFWLINQYSITSEFIKPFYYAFEFNVKSTNTTLNLKNFLLYFDFTQRKGSISFNISKEFSIEHIGIEFPTSVNNNTYEIISNYPFKNRSLDIGSWGMNDRYSTLYRTNLDFWDFQTDYKNDLRIIIKYEMSNISPSGIFIINNIGKKIIFGNYNGDFGINLILGNNYQCSVECITSHEGLTEDRLSYPNDIRLTFDEENQPRDYFRFKMNAVDKGKITFREKALGLGVSLFVVGIIMFIESLVEIIVKFNERPTRNRK